MACIERKLHYDGSGFSRGAKQGYFHFLPLSALISHTTLQRHFRKIIFLTSSNLNLPIPEADVKASSLCGSAGYRASRLDRSSARTHIVFRQMTA
jgi:hypothetical protein